VTATDTKPEFNVKKMSLWREDTGRIVFMWNGNSDTSDVTIVWYPPPGDSNHTRMVVEYRYEGTLHPTIHDIVLEKDVFLTTGRTTARAVWDRLLACKWEVQESWNFK
jgi:hypothetical protein